MIEQSSSLVSRFFSQKAKLYRNQLTIKQPLFILFTSLIIQSYRIISYCFSFMRWRLPGWVSDRDSTSFIILQFLVLFLYSRQPFIRIEILYPRGSLMKSKFSRVSLPPLILPILHSLRISLCSWSSPRRLKNSLSPLGSGLSQPLMRTVVSMYSFSLVSKLWSKSQCGFQKPERVTILSFSRVAMDRSNFQAPSFLPLRSMIDTMSFFSMKPPLETIRRIMFWVNSSKERKRQPATMGISMRLLITCYQSAQTSLIISPIIIIQC